MEAVVEYEYLAEQEDELTLRIGDIINNVNVSDGGWWEGELNGKRGMFPENFVKLVQKRDTTPSKSGGRQEAPQRKSVRELANKFKDNVPMVAMPKKKEKQKKCKALFEYKKENDDELDLSVGDIIDFNRQVEDGWWEGTLNGKQGVFPSNFVEMIEETSVEDGRQASVEDKEKPIATTAVDTQNKDSTDFHSIKGKKIVGVGLGNIFAKGPVQLRMAADSTKKEETPKPQSNTRQESSESSSDTSLRDRSNTVEHALVRFSYVAEQPDELSLLEGQVVRILDKKLEDDGWWKGEIDGKIGVFPDNFVDIITPEEVSKLKKPAPPVAATLKVALLPKLPEKTPIGDTPADKAEPLASVISKKAQLPPPLVKKPPPQKSIDSSTSSQSIDSSISSSSRSSVKENLTDNHLPKSSGSFSDMEPAGQKLTHLTYGRAPGPKKRPPSSVLVLNDGEKNNVSEDITNSHVLATDKPQSTDRQQSTDKPDKPLPALPPKDYRQKSQPATRTEPITSQPTPLVSVSRDKSSFTNTISSRPPEIPSSAPPPRPPEPVKAPSFSAPASNQDVNKQLLQLLQELNELRTNSVSKTTFNELKTEHEKLKQEFETLKKNHSQKIRDLTDEVDEEKKLRLTTQVEIERVKKFVADSRI